MYIPPYDAVLHNAGTSREELKDAAEVTIPMGLFKFLMQLAVANGDFNEAGYLKANPDVAEAVERGEIESARLHYIGFGYFEGRWALRPTSTSAGTSAPTRTSARR
jgi:hypothetical protein